MAALLRSPAAWMLLSYALVGASLQQSGGLLEPWAFGLMFAAFLACLGAWVLGVRHPERLQEPPPTSLAWMLLAAVLLFVLRSPARGIYVEFLWYHWLSALTLGAGVVAAVVALATRSRHRSAARTGTLLAALAGGVALLTLMPVASPKPFIDVHYMLQTVSERFAAGENPYLTRFSDLYEGRGNSKPLTTYTYPPGNLVLLFPFWAVFGDVRYGLAAMVLAWLWAVWRFARDDRAWAAALLLLGILHPRVQFVVEQGWIDPLILGMLSLALIAHERGNTAVSAAGYGVFLGLKQYLAFFLPHYWLLERNPKTWLLLGLGGIALFVPFFLWDVDATLQNGILFHLEDTFRPDSLTLASALHPFTGLAPGRTWSLGVGAVFCAATLWSCRNPPRMQGFLLATTVTTFAIFFLGSQAFGNYYFLVAGLQLLFLSRMGRHEA